LARFLTTFEFDRKYLRNGSAKRKSEKHLGVGRKKLVNFGPRTKQLWVLMLIRPSGLFRETAFRP